MKAKKIGALFALALFVISLVSLSLAQADDTGVTNGPDHIVRTVQQTSENLADKRNDLSKVLQSDRRPDLRGTEQAVEALTNMGHNVNNVNYGLNAYNEAHRGYQTNLQEMAQYKEIVTNCRANSELTECETLPDHLHQLKVNSALNALQVLEVSQNTLLEYAAEMESSDDAALEIASDVGIRLGHIKDLKQKLSTELTKDELRDVAESVRSEIKNSNAIYQSDAYKARLYKFNHLIDKLEDGKDKVKNLGDSLENQGIDVKDFPAKLTDLEASLQKARDIKDNIYNILHDMADLKYNAEGEITDEFLEAMRENKAALKSNADDFKMEIKDARDLLKMAVNVLRNAKNTAVTPVNG